MFECFKSKITRMKKARRLTIESQRYQKIAGLLGPSNDDAATFDHMHELIARASSIENASCGCEVCSMIRLHRRGAPK